MATLKQRLHRKNSSGSYDTIYLETLASLVKMDDGTTLTSKISSMDTAINGKAASGHTHSAATTSAAGFMTGAMVTKLNGIAAGANKYTHPSAKQCNYAYTHPSTKQCNYSVDTSGFATTAQLNEVKTSVSNGKSAIASAITDKGVSTAASADFSTMANNIRSIQVNEPHILITQPQLSIGKTSKLSLRLSSSSSEFSRLLSLTRNTYKLQMSLYVYLKWVSNMGYETFAVISSTVGSNALTIKCEDLGGQTSPGRTANYIIHDDWIEFSCCSNFGELRDSPFATTRYLSADSWIYV